MDLVQNNYPDDLSDSLFREMIRKNLLLISVMFGLVFIVSFFLFKYVAETTYLVRQEICLVDNNKVLKGTSKENQRFLRLLKQRNVRATLVKSNNLIHKFNIDATHKNAVYLLDKALIDHLKVEEQAMGAIQVRYISESTESSRAILSQLVSLALTNLNKEKHSSFKSRIVFERRKTLSPKFHSILFLISAPVMLLLIIFIAVKQKLYLDLTHE